MSSPILGLHLHRRSGRYVIVSLLIVATLFVFAPVVQADPPDGPPGPPELPGGNGNGNGNANGHEHAPGLNHVPPPWANDFGDFIPPGATVAGENVSADEDAAHPFDNVRDNVFLFNEDQTDMGGVAVVVEAGTVAAPATLNFTPNAATTITATGQVTTTGAVPLMGFQVELTDTNGDTLIPTFNKKARLVLDLRPLTAELAGSWHNFYLAYRDEANPSHWIQVDITVYDETGLISADVDHFSE